MNSSTGRLGWLCLAAASLHGAALAQDWSALSSTQARLQHDSNPGLSSLAARALTTRQLSARGELTRRSESGESGAEAELILSNDNGSGSTTTALGRAALRQRWAIERHTWQAGLSYRRDRPLDGAATAGAVALGRNEQSVSEASLSWSHALTERLTGELSGGYTETRPGAGGGAGAGAGLGVVAQDYAVGTGTAALQYAWDETSSLSASLGRTRQSLERSDTRITIDSLRLGWAAALSEVASLNVSLAQSRTAQGFTLRGFACPLPVQFCNSNIVPFVPTETRLNTRREQLQYSLGGSLRLDPVSTLTASATRALTPSSLGVNREDRWALSVSRSWSERWRASLSVDASRTAPPAGTTPSARLRSLSLDASLSLSERLTLALQAQARRYSASAPQSGASSRVFSISLQYLGATVPGWR